MKMMKKGLNYLSLLILDTIKITVPFQGLMSSAKSLLRFSSASASASPNISSPNFGIMFDIDGVIVRGKNVLPSAPEAFSLLYNKEQERWRVPSIFVTNAGNTLRQEKADKLSDWLQVPVTEDQVVMSHSPLKMFTEYHSKHVLVMGQGAVHHIASSLGFTNVTTMDELRHAFPALDAVDHKRRRAAPCAFNKYFPRIEAVIMFGEPVRWETSLQVIKHFSRPNFKEILTDQSPSGFGNIIRFYCLLVLPSWNKKF